MATALTLHAGERSDAAVRATATRDAVLDGVLATVPGAVVTGSRTSRLPGHASFCFPGVHGETVLLELEQRDVVSSSGSACAAGSTEASHVLTALGLDEDTARSAVRLTFDESLAPSDVPAVVGAVRDAVAAVRALA